MHQNVFKDASKGIKGCVVITFLVILNSSYFERWLNFKDFFKDKSMKDNKQESIQKKKIRLPKKNKEPFFWEFKSSSKSYYVYTK